MKKLLIMMLAALLTIVAPCASKADLATGSWTVTNYPESSFDKLNNGYWYEIFQNGPGSLESTLMAYSGYRTGNTTVNSSQWSFDQATLSSVVNLKASDPGSYWDYQTTYISGHLRLAQALWGEATDVYGMTAINKSKINEAGQLQFEISIAGEKNINGTDYLFNMLATFNGQNTNTDAAGYYTLLSSAQLGYGFGSVQVDITPVPIPAAAWLLGSGLLGLVAIRRKFRS
jgi:hypothetical protein